MDLNLSQSGGFETKFMIDFEEFLNKFQISNKNFKISNKNPKKSFKLTVYEDPDQVRVVYCPPKSNPTEL